jgi:hypothetical protein
MKRTIKIAVLSLMLSLIVPITHLNAQLFDEGDKIVSFGVGFGATYYVLGSAYSTTIPPLFVAGDYCFREDLGPGNLGLGAYFGVSGYKSKWHYAGDDYGYKYTSIIIGARGTYHFTDLVDKLDLYGGVMIGPEIVISKYYGDDNDTYDDISPDGSGVAYDVFAGARYFLTDNFAGMVELGYGISWFKMGISLKF